jgi:hypothetical protein
MNFDDMKKIWDTQTNEPLYAVNEKALHKSITSKKDKGLRIANIGELISIVNFSTAAVVLMIGKTNMYMIILSVWMFLTAIYSLAGRIRRLRGEKKYDRSMLGDLEYAVDTATYMVRFSGLMRWNIVPICVLIALGFQDKPTVFIIGLIAFFAITFYASSLEHNYYKRRRNDLEKLRNFLTTN